MLRSLSVENFASARKASLELSAGFVALTGETGAGKSIVVDALGAALGARAESEWVRRGARRATVSAVFDVTLKARAWLEERGIDCPDGEVCLRRSIEAEGRSKAWINGASVSGTELRGLGTLLAQINGQHESVALLGSRAQREHLDAYAAHKPLLDQVDGAHASWTSARKAAAAAREKGQELAKSREALAWESDELDRARPVEGEWASLENEQKRAAQAGEINEACELATQVLSEGAQSACDQLARVARALSGLGSERLDQAALAVEQAREIAQDAAREVERYRETEDLSAGRIAEVEARLAVLHALARKLRRAPETLAARAAEVQILLAGADAALDEGVLARQEAAALAELKRACTILSLSRKNAAERLGRAASANLAQLDMDKTRLEIRLIPKEPGAEGADLIEFVLDQQGLGPLPLSKCASGGELSRVGLAIACASLSQEQVPCMVFDEVDAGVGGEAGLKVGKMLSKLGNKSQALAVTHLPQVAACARVHWTIEKKQAEEGPETQAHEVHGDAREREIARMLGGAKLGSAIKHAKALLASH